MIVWNLGLLIPHPPPLPPPPPASSHTVGCPPHPAKQVQAALRERGFWTCDVDTAAKRKLSQKLNEEYVEEDADDDEGY